MQKKPSAFRGEAVFERREEEKKGERREGRPDGQTCASAWICRNVERAEAVDVTWGKGCCLLSLTRLPQDTDGWRLAEAGQAQELSIRSLETLIPGRLLTGTLILISMQPEPLWKRPAGLRISCCFIYLFIYLHGCHGRAH